MNKVFVFLPNLIGYLRIMVYLASFLCHTLGSWQLCIILYSFGFLLDEFDGRAARLLDQSTNFGAALDMVVDRCAIAGLCLILAQLYPNYAVAFILLIALDVSSHYYLIYVTSLVDNPSHKDTATWSKNWLLNLYYGNKQFMDVLILGNELFYIFLYLAYYAIGFSWFWMGYSLTIWQAAIVLCLPIYSLKQVTNLLQLQSAARKIAAIDLAKRKEAG